MSPLQSDWINSSHLIFSSSNLRTRVTRLQRASAAGNKENGQNRPWMNLYTRAGSLSAMYYDYVLYMTAYSKLLNKGFLETFFLYCLLSNVQCNGAEYGNCIFIFFHITYHHYAAKAISMYLQNCTMHMLLYWILNSVLV